MIQWGMQIKVHFLTFISITNLGYSLLDGLPLLHFREVMVVERNIGHDGLLIRM